MKKPNVVLIGGGVGSSTFTKALKDLPINLTTIVSAFDDGGSTGSVRRDYGGIALGDFRQSLLASLPLDKMMIRSLNHRFGRGSLYGVNLGNLILRSFLDQHSDERQGVKDLHRIFHLKNTVIPISYDFSKLCAKLSNGRVLGDQQQVAEHLSFSEASIKQMFLEPKANINPEARQAILRADYLIFAPGHFFTSVLPHLYVKGFSAAWRKSRAKKIWFVNLLAHRGQDSFYELKDYLKWFQQSLGQNPFTAVVINKAIPNKILSMVKDRFEKTNIIEEDLDYLRSKKLKIITANLVSHSVRSQQKNDTVMRAPLRHDSKKIRKFFQNILLKLK